MAKKKVKYKKYIDVIIMMIAEDRAEMRDVKGRFSNVSYYFVALYVGVIAFVLSLNTNEFFTLFWILAACCALFVYYIALYKVYTRDLNSIRKCLQMRELYIQDFAEFKNRKLQPIGSTDNAPLKEFKDNEFNIYLLSVLIFFLFGTATIILKFYNNLNFGGDNNNLIINNF